MPTYYSILQIHPGADVRTIRESYFRLIGVYHPDRCNGDPEFTHFHASRINEAFAVLGDPERRAQYDAALSRARKSRLLLWLDRVWTELTLFRARTLRAGLARVQRPRPALRKSAATAKSWAAGASTRLRSAKAGASADSLSSGAAARLRSTRAGAARTMKPLAGGAAAGPDTAPASASRARGSLAGANIPASFEGLKGLRAIPVWTVMAVPMLLIYLATPERVSRPGMKSGVDVPEIQEPVSATETDPDSASTPLASNADHPPPRQSYSSEPPAARARIANRLSDRVPETARSTQPPRPEARPFVSQPRTANSAPAPSAVPAQRRTQPNQAVPSAPSAPRDGPEDRSDPESRRRACFPLLVSEGAPAYSACLAGNR